MSTSTASAPRSTAASLRDVLGLFFVTLLLIRGIVSALSGVLWDLPLALVPVLFMWAPVWFMRWRGEDPDRFPLSVPDPRDEAEVWVRAARAAGVMIVAITIPYVAIYHLWQTSLFPGILTELCDRDVRAACVEARRAITFAPSLRLPDEPLKLIFYHLFFVALPEELFYRGWMQSRLDEVWAPRWQVMGATVGPSLFVTSLIFAFGHSLVTFQWWHFAIFFPALLFGWLRARTGHVLAGAMFHAWCNILVSFLDAAWGVST